MNGTCTDWYTDVVTTDCKLMGPTAQDYIDLHLILNFLGINCLAPLYLPTIAVLIFIVMNKYNRREETIEDRKEKKAQKIKDTNDLYAPQPVNFASKYNAILLNGT